ncbi:MAG: YbaN family protein [Planctomycetes bacterium]|jgi:hypothetical protein|nr:YbaN family protein [Planctomycetota bacterium]
MTAEGQNRPDRARPHASRLLRGVLFAAGCLCVVLGAVGAFLPILPTVPFLLLAAACYARSSERFHRRLLSSRMFGATLRAWEDHRCIPVRARRVALALVLLAFGSSAALHLHRPIIAAALVAAGVLAFALVARIPRCGCADPAPVKSGRKSPPPNGR